MRKELILENLENDIQKVQKTLKHFIVVLQNFKITFPELKISLEYN